MPPLRADRPGRLALVLTACGLMFLVTIGLYFFVENRLRVSAARVAANELPREAVSTEIIRLVAVLLGCLLLILLFVLGGYLFLRLGRAVSQEPLGDKPTEYIDAWSRYRLSDEQIRAATQEDQPPDEPDSQADDSDGPQPAR